MVSKTQKPPEWIKRCEFDFEAGENCEECRSVPADLACWFVPGGYWDSREGTYICTPCALRREEN